MNKVVRKNLRIRLGDIVQIKAAGDVPNFAKIHVLPFEDTIEGIFDIAKKMAFFPRKSITFLSFLNFFA